MDAQTDDRVSYLEAEAIIETVAALPAWAAPIDVAVGQGDFIRVRRRLNGRYEAAVPPVVPLAEIVQTIALVGLVHEADDLLGAPGFELAFMHQSAVDGIEDACQAALAAYRASAAA
jgi:hypothetical protein